MARADARILLADDMKTVLMIEQGLFERLGMHPDLAESGNMALEALSSREYDLAFLDLNMPDFGGDGVIARFLESGHEKKPVFIAVTTDEPGICDRCRMAGFADVIFKPVSPVAIVDVIKNYYQG